MDCIGILVVDDHAVLRDGLTLLLNTQPDMCVLGQAGDGEEALARARVLRPDVVLLDLVMPGLSGLETARQLKAELPDTKVIALTMHEDESYLVGMLRAQADGYVLKRSPSEKLVQTIRDVMAGHCRFDAGLAERALAGSFNTPPGDSGGTGEQLDERELQVLRLLAWGYANQQIAARLRLNVKSIAGCRQRISAKLGLTSRVDLVRYAVQKGLLAGQPE